jgi:hypothetical protein
MAVSAREEQSGTPRTAAYALPGGVVALDTDDPSLRCWLDEFLMPGFDPVASATGAPRVVVTTTDDVPRGLQPVGARPCFALDQRVVEHPAFRSPDGIVVTDEQYGTWYLVGADTVQVSRDAPAPRTRSSVMRVLRELATAQALADGSRIQLHAAALEHDGRLIVLAGPKEAGKTTLTMRLASIGGLAIAGNDRLLLSAPSDRDGAWLVRAVPTVVSVRAGTRSQLVGRFDDLPAIPAPAHLTISELAAVADDDVRGVDVAAERMRLSPAQFARAAGVPLCGEAPLAHVLLISVDPALDDYDLAACTREQGRTGLDTVRYGSRRDGMPRTIFEEWLGVTRPPDADRARLDELADAVPTSRLRVGRRVLDDDALAAALLEEIVGDV